MEKKELLKKSWEDTSRSAFLKNFTKVEKENATDFFEKISGEKWKNVYDKNSEKNKVIICADERVVPFDGESKIGIAGQLILCPKSDLEKFVTNYQGKIKAVRSHNGCGAAGIAEGKLSEEEKNKIYKEAESLGFHSSLIDDWDEISAGDKLGAAFSYILAKRVEAEFYHLKYDEMRGEKPFHDARMIFWSNDPSFDATSLLPEILPPHFLSSSLAYSLSQEYAKAELKILSGIALGSHGFFDLFTKTTPFYVVSVGKNLQESKEMNKKAKMILKEFGDRIRFLYI